MERGPDFAAIRASSRHGTRARYKSGCRCDPCRGSNTAYHRRRREARLQPVEAPSDTAEAIGRFLGFSLRTGAVALFVLGLIRRMSSQIR